MACCRLKVKKLQRESSHGLLLILWSISGFCTYCLLVFKSWIWWQANTVLFPELFYNIDFRTSFVCWTNLCKQVSKQVSVYLSKKIWKLQRAIEGIKSLMFLKIMFKCVEIFCSLKHVRGFAPYGWTNVRQCHLTSSGFCRRGIWVLHWKLYAYTVLFVFFVFSFIM